MQKYVHKNPLQDYTVSDFKEQYRITRRELAMAKWDLY
jgi:hypothetical protein